MVAARLASRPLLPRGVPEEAAGAVSAGTSAWRLDRGSGARSASGAASEGPAKQIHIQDSAIVIAVSKFCHHQL